MKLLGLDLFLSFRLYGLRPASHFDAYRKDAGWYAIEVGSWSLDVTVEDPMQNLRTLAVLAAIALAVYCGDARSMNVYASITIKGSNA